MASGEIDRLKRSLENRENQLKEMSLQLSQHLSLIEEKNKQVADLEAQLQVATVKLQKKEQQLDQERKAKEIMFNRLTMLEKQTEKANQQRTSTLQRVRNFFTSKPAEEDQSITSAYVDFYSKIQVEGQNAQLKQVPTFEVDHEVAPPPQKDLELPVTQDDLDITKELEKMGIKDIANKY
jgi:chromosome segregation ATPase